MNYTPDNLRNLDRQIRYLEGVNFDSNGMEQIELDALKTKRAAMEAERIKEINSDAFLSQ